MKIVRFPPRVAHCIRLTREPSGAWPSDAYCLFAPSHAAEQIVKRQLSKLNGDDAVQIPRDIEGQARNHLGRRATERDKLDAAMLSGQQIIPVLTDRAFRDDQKGMRAGYRVRKVNGRWRAWIERQAG
jgi:hypothetical protein